jgi:glycosyltransferase involved in cell wall biosynthesis
MKEPSELTRLAERIALLEARLTRAEQTTRNLQGLLDRQIRRSWRAKFEPKLWQFFQYPPRVLRPPSVYDELTPPTNAPRIAIVTPTFNDAKYLQATIDSVLAQRYPNLTYLIQDGGSTDGTVELLKSYGSKIAWHSEQDTGQGNAINRGFGRISGEIMAYLNSDDILLPGTLAYVAHAFQADLSIDVVYAHRIFIDESGLETGRCVLPPHDERTVKWADFIPQETLFWRRKVWEKVGPFDENFHFALDWDFILRAQASGFRFKRLPRFLGCFRVHDEQKTTAMMEVGHNKQRQLRRIHLGRDPTGPEVDRAIRPYLRRHVLFHRLYKLKLLNY